MKLLIIPGIPIAVITAALDLDKASIPAGAIAALHGIRTTLPVLLVLALICFCLRAKRC